MRLLKVSILSLLLSGSALFAQDNIKIPNVITPNGDGVNDILTIRTVGFENITCTVVNRYGEIIYRFYGLNGSWDGFTHAGEKVAAGVYYVSVEAEDASGNITFRQGVLHVSY